jgi:hypothetical protein
VLLMIAYYNHKSLIFILSGERILPIINNRGRQSRQLIDPAKLTQLWWGYESRRALLCSQDFHLIFYIDFFNLSASHFHLHVSLPQSSLHLAGPQ